MKTIFATLSSLVILAVAWLVIALSLGVIGMVGSLARPGLDLILLIHVLLMHVLSPGIGAFFAIYLTSLMFRAVVDLKILYVSFISIVAILCLVGLISLSSHKRSTEEMIMFMIQSAAIFLGAWVGRRFGSYRRTLEGTLVADS